MNIRRVHLKPFAFLTSNNMEMTSQLHAVPGERANPSAGSRVSSGNEEKNLNTPVQNRKRTLNARYPWTGYHSGALSTAVGVKSLNTPARIEAMTVPTSCFSPRHTRLSRPWLRENRWMRGPCMAAFTCLKQTVLMT